MGPRSCIEREFGDNGDAWYSLISHDATYVILWDADLGPEDSGVERGFAVFIFVLVDEPEAKVCHVELFEKTSMARTAGEGRRRKMGDVRPNSSARHVASRDHLRAPSRSSLAAHQIVRLDREVLEIYRRDELDHEVGHIPNHLRSSNRVR